MTPQSLYVDEEMKSNTDKIIYIFKDKRLQDYSDIWFEWEEGSYLLRHFNIKNRKTICLMETVLYGPTKTQAFIAIDNWVKIILKVLPKEYAKEEEVMNLIELEPAPVHNSLENQSIMKILPTLQIK